MANYIGAKTAGVIANVDGGTIENATLASSVTFPNYQLSGIVSISSSSVSQEVTFPSGKDVVLWTHWKYVSGSDQRSLSHFITINGSDNTYTQSGASLSLIHISEPTRPY